MPGAVVRSSGVHLDVAARVGLHPGGGEIEPVGVRDPADRDDGKRRVDVRLRTALGIDKSHSSGTRLEALDRSGVLEDPHPGGLQRRAHRCRHLLVLAHEDAGGRLEQGDPRSEGVEDRGDLDASRTGADHQQRVGRGREAPRVAVGAGQLETGHWELPRHAAGAYDDVRGSQSRSVVALDHVRVDEAGGSGVLVDGHAGPLELVAQERVRAHLAGYLAHAGEQTPIVERGLAGADSVARELPRLPHQPRRVGQGPHRHRPVVRGHSPELVARDERRSSSESRRAQRSDDARRPGADHDHIEVVSACGRHFVMRRSRPAVVIGRCA